MAQPGEPGSVFEPLLMSQSDLVLEHETKPLGMLEGSGLGVGFKVFEAFCGTVQAEFMQDVEGRMVQHVHLHQWK
jgi:hypothetical protein